MNKAQLNTVSSWFENYLSFNTECTSTLSNIYANYKDFCKEKSVPIHKRTFVIILKRTMADKEKDGTIKFAYYKRQENEISDMTGSVVHGICNKPKIK